MMNNTRDIHAFARKYKKLYANLKTASEDLFEDFRIACVSFGFDQEEYAMFKELYGEEAYQDAHAFQEAHDSIQEVMVLGNAIYTRWKDTVMSSYYVDELLKKENRDWFIAACTRLSELTSEEIRKTYDFAVRLSSVKIISRKFYWGERLSADKENEQRLTIRSNGKVSLSRYRPGTKKGKNELIEKKNLNIEPEDAEFLLNEISAYFKDDSFAWITPDQDQFEIEMISVDHRQIRLVQAMDENDSDLSRLSALIRDILETEDLFAFDGRENQA